MEKEKQGRYVSAEEQLAYTLNRDNDDRDGKGEKPLMDFSIDAKGKSAEAQSIIKTGNSLRSSRPLCPRDQR